MKSKAATPGSSSFLDDSWARTWALAASADVEKAACASHSRRVCDPFMVSTRGSRGVRLVSGDCDGRLWHADLLGLLEDGPPHLGDLPHRQPAAQQIAAVTQVLGSRCGGRRGATPA